MIKDNKIKQYSITSFLDNIESNVNIFSQKTKFSKALKLNGYIKDIFELTSNYGWFLQRNTVYRITSILFLFLFLFLFLLFLFFFLLLFFFLFLLFLFFFFNNCCSFIYFIYLFIYLFYYIYLFIYIIIYLLNLFILLYLFIIFIYLFIYL